MTVPYQINDCEHVLLMDGSRRAPIAVTTRTVVLSGVTSGGQGPDICSPIAVTTRTVESTKKIVKILSGITEVQMIPASGSMKVLVNGQPIALPAIGEQLIKKSPEGRILLIVQRFEDNVVWVNIPQHMLKVLSNGSVIEVVAPLLLKSRTVGLCGDMNGERSADLKTPGMCVLRPRLAALSFMLNKSGEQAGFERCSGLPAALKEEFVRESRECPREVIIPTSVSKLYEHISLGGKWDPLCTLGFYDCGPRWLGGKWDPWGVEWLNEGTSGLSIPTGVKHIVDKQSNQLCVSKQMVKTCLSKPVSIKKKSVEFACIPQPSVKASSLQKRALSGQSLLQEISQLPTVFRKEELEAVACSSDISLGKGACKTIPP